MMSLEDFKKAWKELELEEAKRAFTIHLASYITVNMFLAFVNLYTASRDLWFPWVLAAWGIGLVFHFVFSRPRFVISNWEEKVAKIEYRVKSKQ